MSKEIAYNGQSFLNKVIETTGSIENAFEMGILNDINITEDLVIGQKVKTSKATAIGVATFFDESNKPATNLNQAQVDEITNYGIGTMIIETNFIVG